MPKERQHSGALSGLENRKVPQYSGESWLCTMLWMNRCLTLKRNCRQQEERLKHCPGLYISGAAEGLLKVS